MTYYCMTTTDYEASRIRMWMYKRILLEMMMKVTSSPIYIYIVGRGRGGNGKRRVK